MSQKPYARFPVGLPGISGGFAFGEKSADWCCGGVSPAGNQVFRLPYEYGAAAFFEYNFQYFRADILN